MNADRWNQIADVFAGVADCSSERRNALLEETCSQDPELRAEVERLLANHAAAETREFLQEPPWVVDALPAVLPDFDDYCNIEYLGHGGIGVVYRAFDKSLNTDVALKMSLPRRLTTAKDANWFRVEPRAIARLKHPNVVQVHRVGEWNGNPYFTMNLVRRKDNLVSLEKHVARYKEDPAGAVRLMIQVARAIHHAHQRRLLHRDLKPGNILLDDEENPYVTDLGLAKEIGPNAKLTEANETLGEASPTYQAIVGTVPYMSPEQADPRSATEVTTLSDVYGLGATLYTLLTGRAPFQANTLEATLQLVRDPDRKPRPPRELNPRVDRILESICLKCLNKEPSRRYPSAESFAKNLERWLYNEGDIDPPPPIWLRIRNWYRRNSGAATLTIASVVLFVLSVVMASIAAKHMESQLRESAGRSLARAAERIADIFRRELEFLGDKVVDMAKNPEVHRLLHETRTIQTHKEAQDFHESDQGREFQDAFDELFTRHNADLIRRKGIPFATMFFVNQNGVLVAHAGPQGPARKIIGMRVENRDYFVTAKRYADSGKRGMDAVHISRAFQSIYDEYFKFAISMPVLDEKGDFLGVVEASIPMDDTMGLAEPLLYEDQRVVLAGRVDANPHAQDADKKDYMRDEWLILLHEAFGGENKDEMRKKFFPLPGSLDAGRIWPTIDAKRSELDSIPPQRLAPDYDYADPLENDSEDYKGRRLAGFAQVGNTELVVIVQQRYAATVGHPTLIAKRFVLWGWISLTLAVMLAGVVVCLRGCRSARL